MHVALNPTATAEGGVPYGPTQARAYAMVAVLEAFAEDMDLVHGLIDDDYDEIVSRTPLEAREASVAQLIYNACWGLFSTDEDGVPHPEPAKQEDFVRNLEGVGVTRFEIARVLSYIPGGWVRGWPQEYSLGYEPLSDQGPLIENVRADARRARPRQGPAR